jgi:hypothetical protein
LAFKEIIYSLDFDYIGEKPFLKSLSKIGFMFHYVSLICIAFQLFILHKIIKENNKTSTKILNWSLVIVVTFLASSEVLLQVLKLKINPILPQIDDSSNALYFANFENYNHVSKQTVKVLFPILWGVLSFVFLWFGIKKQLKHLRIAALYLLALTLVKLVVYDIREVSEGGKILAFILLGIVLLIISFMYQKIKAIIINEDPKESNHEENI